MAFFEKALFLKIVVQATVKHNTIIKYIYFIFISKSKIILIFNLYLLFSRFKKKKLRLNTRVWTAPQKNDLLEVKTIGRLTGRIRLGGFREIGRARLCSRSTGFGRYATT